MKTLIDETTKEILYCFSECQVRVTIKGEESIKGFDITIHPFTNGKEEKYIIFIENFVPKLEVYVQLVNWMGISDKIIKAELADVLWHLHMFLLEINGVIEQLKRLQEKELCYYLAEVNTAEDVFYSYAVSGLKNKIKKVFETYHIYLPKQGHMKELLSVYWNRYDMGVVLQ